MAEEEGFEPPRSLHLLSVFETDPFSRLGIPPTSIDYSINVFEDVSLIYMIIH